LGHHHVDAINTSENHSGDGLHFAAEIEPWAFWLAWSSRANLSAQTVDEIFIRGSLRLIPEILNAMDMPFLLGKQYGMIRPLLKAETSSAL
jgi:hypothetical protein